MATNPSGQIDSVLTEVRKFDPPAEFSSKAWIKSLAEHEALCNRAADDPEGFWAECARNLDWFKPFDKFLEWKFPFAKWFVGAGSMRPTTALTVI